MSEMKKKNQPAPVTRWDLFKVFLASFFIQSVWNFRSLISIGFSVCLVPVLNKLYSGNEEKRGFLVRHLHFFNAHPYFASYALGVSIRLEEMAAKGEIQNLEALEKIKDLLIGPLGAIGDRLFWATIKPACLIFGMFSTFVSPTIELKIFSLIITFLLFNIPHLYFRYHGIIEGYKYGLEIYKHIGQKQFENLRKFYLNFLILSIFVFVVAFFKEHFVERPLFILVFLLAAVYATIFNNLVKNFYYTCIATLSFCVVIGILFF